MFQLLIQFCFQSLGSRDEIFGGRKIPKYTKVYNLIYKLQYPIFIGSEKLLVVLVVCLLWTCITVYNIPSKYLYTFNKGHM